MGYPEHKRIVSSLRRTWYRHSGWNLDKLADEIVQKMKEQKEIIF